MSKGRNAFGWTAKKAYIILMSLTAINLFFFVLNISFQNYVIALMNIGAAVFSGYVAHTHITPDAD